MANLKASLSQDELGKLVKLIKLIDSNKLLNEIDKLMFNNESTFVRFLMSANYNHEVAFEQFKAFITWRKQNNVDVILDSEEINEQKVKQCYPNTWFHTDAQGRPVWIFQLSDENEADFKELSKEQVQSLSLHLRKYVIREIENTWREKFQVTQSDQFVLLIDLGGIESISYLELLANSLFSDLQLYYPLIIAETHFINAPETFEMKIYPELYQPLLHTINCKKRSISQECDESVSNLGLKKVPRCYGGKASFNIDLEEGPWIQSMNGFSFNMGAQEETKESSTSGKTLAFDSMIEQEDDQVELLKGDADDDRRNFDFSDLKAQLSQMLPPPNRSTVRDSQKPSLYGDQIVNTLADEELNNK